jgi:hypothetical protein
VIIVSDERVVVRHILPMREIDSAAKVELVLQLAANSPDFARKPIQ